MPLKRSTGLVIGPRNCALPGIPSLRPGSWLLDLLLPVRRPPPYARHPLTRTHPEMSAVVEALQIAPPFPICQLVAESAQPFRNRTQPTMCGAAAHEHSPRTWSHYGQPPHSLETWVTPGPLLCHTCRWRIPSCEKRLDALAL